MRRLGLILAGLLLVLLGAAIFVRAPDQAHFPPNPLGREVAQATRDLPQDAAHVWVDRPALARNIERVKTRVGQPYGIRWVAKSLPSIPLLQFVAETSGIRRFMVFQESMALVILRQIPEADLLFGKPIPALLAEEVLRTQPGAERQVHWLVDSIDRLREYELLAQRTGRTLSIVLEVDVGLRRGGFRTPEDLASTFGVFLGARQERSDQGRLELRGLMGYDGHVPHASSLLGPGKDRAEAREFDQVLARFAGFAERVKGAFAPPVGGWIFDGGGSRTFWRYGGRTSAFNELAVGSILLKPTHFDSEEVADFEPAAFLSIPVLKRVDQPFPFVESLGPLWGAVRRLNPNVQQGFYLYGSVWGGEILYPQGLREAWFHAPGIQNLLPNQQLLMGSADVLFPEGRRVIVRPPEGDTLVALDRWWASPFGSGKRQSGRTLWAPLPHRN
jgi:hypothetical protein